MKKGTIQAILNTTTEVYLITICLPCGLADCAQKQKKQLMSNSTSFCRFGSGWTAFLSHTQIWARFSSDLNRPLLGVSFPRDNFLCWYLLLFGICVFFCYELVCWTTKHDVQNRLPNSKYASKCQTRLAKNVFTMLRSSIVFFLFCRSKISQNK